MVTAGGEGEEEKGGKFSIVRMWDLKTGSLVKTFEHQSDEEIWVTGLTFSHSRHAMMATSTATKNSSETSRAWLWDIDSGKLIRTFDGHRSGVQDVAFDSKGERLVTAGIAENAARIWDVSSGTEICTLLGHTNWVWSAAFSHDGEFVVTASEDHTARIWDVRTGDELGVLSGSASGVSSAAFSPNDTQILTASRDGTMRIYDLELGGKLKELIETANQRARPLSPGERSKYLHDGSTERPATTRMK
jgi:WD40 repeat protein